MRYGFGVDIGGTTVKIAWFEESGKMLREWEIPTVRENEGAQILPDVAASLNAFLHENGTPKEQVIGIGVGVPGPVNSKSIVNRCVNLGWDMCLVWGWYCLLVPSKASINKSREKLKVNIDLFVPGSRRPILMTLPSLGDLPLA